MNILRPELQPTNGAALLAAIRMPSDRLSVAANDVLEIDGQTVTALVERFGSPLQVAVEPTLRENYRRIRQAFTTRWQAGVNVMYSIKCNNNFAIRAILSTEGAGGDCFGLSELYASLAGGADPRLLVMNGSNKSREEVATAIALGITINVDAIDEIVYVEETARRTGQRARVNLRLKIAPEDLESHLAPAYQTPEGAAAGVRRTKWGFTPAAAAPLVTALASMPGVELRGYSAHIGHQSTQPEAFASVAREFGAAVVELERVTGFVPAVLDIGGGWAQMREPSAREFAVNPVTIETYADASTAALRAALGARDRLPELWLEPGRYITSNAQVLLAAIGSIKRDAGFTWLHVDASTNDLQRIESGRHWYHLLPATRMSAPFAEATEIVGGTCFKSVIGTQRRMPILQRGDLIAVLDTGMYAEVFSNQFNGLPRPATVLVGPGGAEPIRRRETIGDVFATQIVPPRLADIAPPHESGAAFLAAMRGD